MDCRGATLETGYSSGCWSSPGKERPGATEIISRIGKSWQVGTTPCGGIACRISLGSGLGNGRRGKE
jgi:hypothetical protein